MRHWHILTSSLTLVYGQRSETWGFRLPYHLADFCFAVCRPRRQDVRWIACFLRTERQRPVLLENELAICIGRCLFSVSEGAQPGGPPSACGQLPGAAPAGGQTPWCLSCEAKEEQLSAQGRTISGWERGAELRRGGLVGRFFHAHWHLIPRRRGDC